jgi:polysaccharide biosynthesis protein PslH
MKILQLTNKIPYPPRDGGAIATLSLSLSFARQGHQVTLLGMNTSKHYCDMENLPDSITSHIKMESVDVNTDLSFWDAIKNLLFSRLPYNATRFISKNFSNKLIEILQNQKFDVIQLEGLYMAYYIDVIRKHSDALIALRAHNIEHEIWDRTSKQEKSLLRKGYFKLLTRRIKRFKLNKLNKYDLLVPITNRDAEIFHNLGNTRPFCTTPAGFDTGRTQPHRHLIEFPSVFFIGTLDWFPNQEGIIWFLEKVWDKVLQTNPNLQLHIAGRNAPDWIRKIFNKPNVIYLGEIEDAYQFMNCYAIMIVPLFSGSGMRVKIIEGMAMGKTIITTGLGAEGIDITSGVNILIENDAEGFAKRINDLISNRKYFDQIGSNAACFVRDYFDNEKITLTLTEFYKKHIS